MCVRLFAGKCVSIRYIRMDADKNAKCFHYACYYGCLEVARLMLENKLVSMDSWTERTHPLITAVAQEHTELAMMLMDHGVLPDVVRSDEISVESLAIQTNIALADEIVRRRGGQPQDVYQEILKEAIREELVPCMHFALSRMRDRASPESLGQALAVALKRPCGNLAFIDFLLDFDQLDTSLIDDPQVRAVVGRMASDRKNSPSSDQQSGTSVER